MRRLVMCLGLVILGSLVGVRLPAQSYDGDFTVAKVATFSQNTSNYDGAYAAVALPAGGIVAAGHAELALGNRDVSIIHFNELGQVVEHYRYDSGDVKTPQVVNRTTPVSMPRIDVGTSARIDTQLDH